tara:strand:- start:359 stop:541 length:183 start_codon:yes stop_codon:yes gene_type:complete
MISVISIIVGSMGTILSLLYAYEWSGADPYVYIFVTAYTISMGLLSYGCMTICDKLQRRK